MKQTVRRLHHLAAWPVRSQDIARRNALSAARSLAEIRIERQEVERFVAEHLAARDGEGRRHAG
jgi:hypothetical protein